MLLINYSNKKFADGYVATAGGVQEMELNAQTKHCLPKSEKEGLDQ